MDASFKMADFNDAQLQTAVQALRFIDHQTLYTDTEVHQLLMALQASSCLERQLFFEQMRQQQHRREIAMLERTPLQRVFELESEFALLERVAVPLYLRLAMRCEHDMTAKETLKKIDASHDSFLQAWEIRRALRRWQLPCSTEDVWLWLQAANTTLTLENTPTDFINFCRLPLLPKQRVEFAVGTWQPRVKLSLLTDPSIPQTWQLHKAAVAQPESDLLDDDGLMRALRRKQAEAERTVKERAQEITADRERLLLRYEQWDEQHHGSTNPSIDPSDGTITWEFSRLNLPKWLRFHGSPDFIAESNPIYVGAPSPDNLEPRPPHPILAPRPVSMTPRPQPHLTQICRCPSPVPVLSPPPDFPHGPVVPLGPTLTLTLTQQA